MKKNFLKSFLLVVCSFSLLTAFAANEVTKKPIYLNTAYSFKERAVDLVSRMTLEEKQTQLGNTMPPIPRLGVNKYDVWGEALHGVVGRNDNAGKTATSFPNSVAVGCTWDPALIKRETEAIGDEARGFNYDIIFTLTYWSPVIEPCRDPRWGRTAETFGEDPFHISKIGGAFAKGLMGDDAKYLKAVPCGKHFFANNAEFNRHNGSANMDDRDMREFYLLPYKSMIEKEKLPAIMTAYSAVNGVPMSASKFLVDTIAKRTYGMDGYVTGDCDAVQDVVNSHRYAKSRPEAAAMGLKTGVDSDCGGIYQANALEALKQGLITEADMDRALVNMYTIRMRLGEFDPKTIVPYASIDPSFINKPSHNDLALEIATKSIVLLKNNASTKTGKKLLPLNAASIKKIAVLGPQADKVELGDYSGEPEAKYKVSPMAGLKKYIADHNLNIELVSRESGNTSKRTDFLSMRGFTTVHKGVTKDYDAVKFDASSSGLITSGRGAASIRGIKDGDWTAYNNIDVTNLDSIKLNASASGIGGLIEIRVGSKTGNILATQKLEAPARPAGGAPGGMGGMGGMGGFGGMGGGRSTPTISVKINTLGIAGPQTLVFVYREAEPPATDKEILDMAASADVVVLCVGTDQSTGREESDRFDIKLPGNQNELIKSVAAVNPNTIVYIQGMGMVEVEQFKNNANIPGMIFAGYNGQAQGTAIAKVLFGEVNPGGKSSLTWYKSIDDLNDLNDYTLRGGNGKNGRTYMYFKKDVSYEFGYGLSYTTFAYSNIAIDKKAITPNDKVTISVDVKNTGSVAGDEVVQVYVKTPDSPASLERPIKRLRGFKRVSIPAGQTQKVSIEVDCADLWFWDIKNKCITFDKGKYIFEVGASSKDIKGQLTATMSGTYNSVLKTVVIEAEKLVLKPGNTMTTSMTAAMSDDSFFNLKNAKVSYKTNNPAVATIDANGKVTATGVGVALISANVTINGKTVSNSCPVKVMPDLTPKAITIDGKAIEGFTKENKAYSFLMIPGAKLPVVSATAVSSGIKVEVEQAKGIPGTTVVRYLDEISQEKNVYYFNFDGTSVSEEFNASPFGKQWQWVRNNAAKVSMTKKAGALTITSEVGDVSEGTNSAKNILLQSANNDWTIDTKLVCSRNPSQPEHAGIIAYQDDDNFVKFVLRAVSKTSNARLVPGAEETRAGTLDLIIEENGIAKSFGTVNLQTSATGENSLMLRLVKKQGTYTATYSTDGTTFNKVATGPGLLKDIKAGLIVCDGIIIQGMKSMFYFNSDTTKPSSPFDVSFDYFHITNNK